MDFDEILKDPKYQAEFDKRIAKAIETSKSKWDEESERKRIEELQNQTNDLDKDIERYQKTNKYLNSKTEFKEAKTWDKKHEDMW